MLAESKLLIPPLVASGVVLANVIDGLPGTARLVLDLAAIAILLAGFLVLGRLRAQAAASEGAASAWREERDALASRIDRMHGEEKELLAEISELRIQISRLESRPTLETMEAEMKKLASLMAQTADAVSQALSAKP